MQLKATSALSKANLGLRQNMDIDFRTLVSIALKKATCFFNAEKIHISTGE